MRYYGNSSAFIKIQQYGKYYVESLMFGSDTVLADPKDPFLRVAVSFMKQWQLQNCYILI